MKIPMSWLKEYVELDCNIKEFVDKMTMSGSKVESLEAKGAALSKIIVGKVVKIEKHPGADKLLITKINVGTDSPLQIVTGAANLLEGDYVPVAVDGAVLENGKIINSGVLRGEVSEGMLCSIEELGYVRDDYPEAPEDGIYVFKNPQKLGADVAEILELKEDIVEFELTPNRPDCFSLVGMARETAATFNKKLKSPEINVRETGSGDINSMVSVEIKNPELCPRYCARVVKNVKIEPSPQWMRHRLTSAGVRPVNNIVDITNYVMLEMGQPMHAFDIDSIAGGSIIVRNAEDGEDIVTLDGTRRELDSSMLVIADAKGPVAIAGVMGGENSKITGQADAVLFESANFEGVNVRLTAKKIGLRTEASAKFEKCIDPNLAEIALNRAVQLVEDLNAGEVLKGIVDAYPEKREIWEVSYSVDKINGLIGTSLSSSEIENILGKLDIQAQNGIAKIPTFRPDLQTEADLAEEVARMYGYDKITATLVSGTPTIGKKSQKQSFIDSVRASMTAQGFCEALSFAFESPNVFDKLCVSKTSGLRLAAKIKNPLGEDFSIMRTTTINAMLTSLSLNYNKRNEKALLFEIAKIYLPDKLPLDKLPCEIPVLTIGMYGEGDFFNLKGNVEYALKRAGLDIRSVKYTVDENNMVELPHSLSLEYLHPGRKAVISYNGDFLGYIGEVHPKVCENYEIDSKTYICVLYTDNVFKNVMPLSYAPIPKFPIVKRDISFIIREDVLVGEVQDEIYKSGGEFLSETKLFDVYQGKNVEEGHKSMAFSLWFKNMDRTLTDADISPYVKNIVDNLYEKFGAILRDK